MKPSELCVDNFIIYDGKIARIIGTTKKTVSIEFPSGMRIEMLGYDKINPVPITPEFLLDIGFEYTETIKGKLWEYVSKDKRIIMNNDGNFINSLNTWHIHIDNEDMQSIASDEISFVHQLQNIFTNHNYTEIKI